MDILSTILLVVGGVLLLLGILKAVKASQLVAIIGVVLLAFGALGALNVIDFSRVGQTQLQPQPFTVSQQQQLQPQPSSCLPQAITSNGKSQADLLYRNIENASLGYLAASVSANSAGQLIDSGTTTAGSTASYVSLSNIPNCNSGELIATVTTGIGTAASRKLYDVSKGQAVAGYSFNDVSVKKYELRGSGTDVANILARDSSLAAASNGYINGSTSILTYEVSGTGTADGTAYYTNTSLASRGSINFYLDYKVNGSSTSLGAFEEPDGTMISYDTGTAARFSPNSLVLQSDTAGWSLTKLGSCPNDITNNRNTEACWSAPSMKAGTLYRIKGTITADLGDPIASDTKPSIYIDDKVFFRDTDGTIKYQSFSTSGTNQGVGGTILTFVMI